MSASGMKPKVDNLTSHNFLPENEMKTLVEKYQHPILKKYGEMAKEVGGHGGMDFIMDSRLIYCLQNGLPLDMDVYDLAEWCCLAELGELSMDNNCASVAFPDFTRGEWNKIQGYKHAYATQEEEANSMEKAKTFTKKLKEKNFDYIALGHIHKLDFNTEEQQRIVYPGSTVSLGFDEPGKHGMIVGELEKENINLTFVQLDEEQFVKENIDVTNIFSKEELIENINELEIKEDEYVELLLIGNRNFEIDKYTILKYIDNQRIIKIKDQTEIAYDLEKLSNTTTLKGLFVKKMLEKSQNKNISEDEKNIIEKAIEIGLEALE